ncbi:hypothetical protein [Georgenia sp. SYP-B2076]|uniref:hypothetical protein n=1 Tax=Georgenia sp. SYP-B2076 TaxID=2495881 RepID=UPI000F8D39B1|nr:hypothetical protein [Georgenia sp. SYP-B2076]
MEIYDELKQLGGMAKRADLSRTAAQRRQLAEAVHTGLVRYQGNGWFALADADPSIGPSAQRNDHLREREGLLRLGVAAPAFRGAPSGSARPRRATHAVSS